jgi:hypothetical protein
MGRGRLLHDYDWEIHPTWKKHRKPGSNCCANAAYPKRF